MAVLSFENYSFCYALGETPALSDLSFSVDAGAFVLLCGAAGSGKTTLLRALSPALAPQGRESGAVRLFDLPRAQTPPETTGYVHQSPENQPVMDSVWHELAFGLENLGTPPAEIRRRVAEIAGFFGLEPLLERKLHALSGGQKQMVNLAAILAMQPKVLLLDEPVAQLDPIAEKAFLQMVLRINRELGMTVLLSAHRLEEILPLVDRVLMLENGSLRIDAPPDAFVRTVFASGDPICDALPDSVRLAHHLGERTTYPMTVRDGKRWLADKTDRLSPTARDERPPRGQVAVMLDGVYDRYDRRAPFVLRGLSARFERGEIHAVVGDNGSGKSTLLALLSGVRRPVMGKVKRTSGLRAALLPQDPKALFARDTLAADLMEFSSRFGYSRADAEEMAARLGVRHLLTRHPYDLSGGEMQKAALCKLLLTQPDVLLLDEPVKGLDVPARRTLRELLKALSAEGKAVILVTHDLTFAAETADRCSMLSGGVFACTERGRDFFRSNLFYTTGVNRILRGLQDDCVIQEDLKHYAEVD